MSLPYGLLGLLSYRDATGYDLTKIFADSLNHFWHAQSSQIYRELGRLEQSGYISSRSVIQDKRPNKRLYSITDEGRAELARWLAKRAPVFERPHEALLMRVFFGADDPEATRALLESVRDICLAAAEAYPPRILEDIAGYADKIPGGGQKRPYWEMTLDYGVAQARMTAAWAQACIEKMDERGVPASPPNDR